MEEGTPFRVGWLGSFGNGVLSWRLGSEWIEGWDVAIDSSRHLLLAGSATYGAGKNPGTHGLLVIRLRPG